VSDDLTLDELLGELVRREEAMASFAKYVEYVSGLTCVRSWMRLRAVRSAV
jgi:hypothetical protein